METANRGANRVRKRAPNACQRCRQQKIRCSGSSPCSQCTKRKLACTFEDPSVKILVTRGYISDLEQRLAYLEGTRDDNSGIPQTPTSHKRNVSFREPDDEAPYDNEDAAGLSRSDATSPEPPVLNQLASELPQYIQDRTGKPIYLGTSSNWSFGRRILATAYERILRSPLPVNNLLFQGQVYHLDWTNVVGQPEAEHSLPSADFAIYLINAVKFHCGQIFHLFDEEEFMQEFAKFHDGRDLEKPQIWHTHYLLMLALGKAFVVRIGKGDQPPGADHFIDAMKYLPNIAFLYPDELNVMELLCCAALYLHSLDFRSAAYTLIGQALRIALEKGLNTNMRSHHVDEKRAQRCRKIWWTVLVLDRQMSALQGVPMAIRDEDIHADLPHSSPAQREALQLHITLSNLTADIVTTVYGPRVGKQYFINTKAVLKKIGDTTDHLNERFPMARTSRLAAYLHLLHHQCVLLATRPLFFNFFQLRLKDQSRCQVPQSGSIRRLILTGLESAQQIFKILSALQTEGLLETFLPFDLDSNFAAITILQMAHAADNSLVELRLDTARSILDEMICRGNLVARYLKSEMEQLNELLERLPPTHDGGLDAEQQAMIEDIDWAGGFTTEHLMNVADGIDIDGLDWLSTSTMEVLT